MDSQCRGNWCVPDYGLSREYCSACEAHLTEIGIYLLFASLILGLLVPASVFAGSSFAIKVFAAGGLVALPVFFSGIAFSNSFRFSSRPEKALAVNIFGAMAGGILENAVMLGGVPILGILAILLYAGAAVCWFHKEVKSTVPEFPLVAEVAG